MSTNSNVIKATILAISFLSLGTNINGHAAPFNPSFWGFNVTAQTFDYDNRMVAPLANMPFEKWWFHNHLAYPPHPTDITPLPAGSSQTFEIACDKGATSFFASSPGGNIQNGNNPCPELPTTAFHAHDASDAAGCAWAIAYKSDVNDVQPEDFTVFSTNRVCVWTRFNDVQIPARMPPCPNGICICAFFWIHNADAGSAQMFMNGFQCNITNSTSTVPVSKGTLPRLCGANAQYGTTSPHPSNCTYGAKLPFYWLQSERSNIFQDVLQPPVYNTLYNFVDGAQDDIFEDSVLPVYADDGSEQIVSYTVQGSGAVATNGASAVRVSSVSASISSSSSSAVLSTATSTSTSNLNPNNNNNNNNINDEHSATLPISTPTRTISIIPGSTSAGVGVQSSSISPSSISSDGGDTDTSTSDNTSSISSLSSNTDTNTDATFSSNSSNTNSNSNSNTSNSSSNSSKSNSNSKSKTCKRRKAKRSASTSASLLNDISNNADGYTSPAQSYPDPKPNHIRNHNKHRRNTNPFIQFGEENKF